MPALAGLIPTFLDGTGGDRGMPCEAARAYLTEYAPAITAELRIVLDRADHQPSVP